MKWKSNLLIIVCLLLSVFVKAQLLGEDKKQFTHADTLRGSLNDERKWWDVLRYELKIKPKIESKSILGEVKIIFRPVIDIIDNVSLDRPGALMQIDLQDSMQIDSAVSVLKIKGKEHRIKRSVYPLHGENVWYIDFKEPNFRKNLMYSIYVYYHGIPKEAKRAPWDGGLVWSKDTNGNPFVATACQGLGASVWWPCKDHQSDEPDSGVSISITAPDTLVAVSNGRLKNVSASVDRTKTWTWEVKNPINTYGITMNIGRYVNWTDTIMGEGGKLDLSYWALDYNLEKAKKQFQQSKSMLHCFEHWFGKYPFYEDSYKLVEVPFLGMEHQSAIAYGNGYQNGYRGRDLSGSNWGLKWDFIIIHESGHEWFGNNITAKDIADMWIHEGFTNYSETLYTEWLYGKEAAAEYVYGIRGNILNDKPIIGIYGVNEEGSGDMYYKSANMLQNIRNTINNDEVFRKILRGLNKTFYHQTVNTQQVEQYISRVSGIDFSTTFEQYLRTTQIPVLEYYFSADKKKVSFHWSSCVKGFNLPLVFADAKRKVAILPTESWKSIAIQKGEESFWLASFIEKSYFVNARLIDIAPRQ